MQPKIAQKAPYAVDVVADQSYYWCSCGQSKKQPFCDGSHQGSGLAPIKYDATVTKTVYFCGCKQSKNGVLCDGSHNAL